MRFVVAHSASFLLLFLFSLACGYKILVVSPSISASHILLNGRVADVLAKDGQNDVTLLELEYIIPLGSLNASKMANVVRIPGPFVPPAQIAQIKKHLVKNAFQPVSMLGGLFQYKKFQSLVNNACEELITTRRVELDKLRRQKFELIITEQITFCGSGLAHLLAIPVHILLSSGPLQEHVASLVGLPNPSSWLPSALFGHDLSDKMSLAGRFFNLCQSFLVQLWFAYDGMAIGPLTQIFRKHFGQEFRDIGKIVAESPLILVNTDEFVDFPRPTFPNIINIGGLEGMADGNDGERGLKEPFNSEMAKGRRGVIFFSMGSVLPSSDFDERFKRNIFQAFSQLAEYNFIVKVDKEDALSAEIATRIGNVFLTNWAPQTKLLMHSRLKLFISHGGQNSLMETAKAGVPLIAMGFFTDQYRNARVAKRNGWGMAFDKRQLLEGDGEQLRAAIQEVTTDPKYAMNAKRIQKLLLTKPFSAEERLRGSINFLEMNGGKLPELLAESRNMNVIALNNLDLLLLMALSAIIFLALAIILIKRICSIILRARRRPSAKLSNEKED